MEVIGQVAEEVNSQLGHSNRHSNRHRHSFRHSNRHSFRHSIRHSFRHSNRLYSTLPLSTVFLSISSTLPLRRVNLAAVLLYNIEYLRGCLQGY